MPNGKKARTGAKLATAAVPDDSWDWLDQEAGQDDQFDPFGEATTPRDPYETSAQLPAPLTFRHAVGRREYIAGLKREALNVLIPELPAPNVDLYIVGNGSGAEVRHGVNPLAFDFGSFIPHVVRMLGDQGCTAYVSTWTASRIHTLTMLEMLADGRRDRLTFAGDPYFRRRSAAICSEFLSGLQPYGDRARALFWKNHCKAIAIAAPDGARTCVITGSANLSAQPRTEQYVLTTDPAAYVFYRDQFFEAMIANANQKAKQTDQA